MYYKNHTNTRFCRWANFGLKEKIRGYEKLFFRFLSKNQLRGKLNNKQVLPLNGKSNWRFIAFLLCIALALCTPPKNSASAQTHKTPNIQHNPARRASFRGSPVKVALLEVKEKNRCVLVVRKIYFCKMFPERKIFLNLSFANTSLFMPIRSESVKSVNANFYSSKPLPRSIKVRVLGDFFFNFHFLITFSL